MANTAETEAPEDAPAKRGKGLLFGLIGAVVLGGGGFYATYSGMIGGPAPKADSHGETAAMIMPSVSFVPLDPMVISLGPDANASHLRFTAQLEVAPGSAPAVEAVMPRILDVLNTYLHAVSEDELTEPAAMTRLRAQILRRVQVVAGPEHIRDVLITEFVLG